MMTYYNRIVLLLTFVTALSALPACARLSGSLFSVQHLGYADGLNSQRVFSIKEDADDVIWIATKSGVNRYNGNAIRSYSLPGSRFNGDMAGRKTGLFYSRRAGLWAYDNGGRIYRYSRRQDSFVLRYDLTGRISGDILVYKMVIDNNGSMWLALSAGLFRIDPSGRLSRIIGNTGQNDVIVAGNTIFAGTDNGVYRLSADGRHKTLVSRGHDAKSLFYDNQTGRLWMGTLSSGLFVADLPARREWRVGRFSKPVRALVNYDRHNVLVGIDGQGVYSVDKQTMQASEFISVNDNTDKYLYGNGVYAVERDREGNIWIGSYTGGVSVALLENRQAVRYVHERGREQSINSNNVNSVVEDHAGNLWFGTESGLSVKCADGEWSHLLDNVVIVSMCKAAGGGMWIGTYEAGLYLLDSQGNVVKHFSKADGLSSNSIFSVFEDAGGDLWIGALAGNLMLRRRDGRITQYPITLSHTIVPYTAGSVLVASGYGFYIIDKNRGIVRHSLTRAEFPHLNISTYVNDLLLEPDRTHLWLATEAGGLVCYNLRTGRIRVYTVRNGLPSNDVFCLLRTADGRLWISTGKGIALMSGEKITSLNYISGLDGEYNRRAGAILRTGRLVFGGNSGAVEFSPSITNKPDYKALLRITAFRPNFDSPDERREMIPELFDMLAAGKVKVDYWYNTFTVFFEAVNHRYQQDIAYQYCLEGYDTRWSDVTTSGEVTFTKVPPGRYTLRVRCLSDSYRTVLSERSLQIVVSEPWWNTWLAWTFYLAFAGAVVVLIIRYKGSMLKKRYDEDKINFFTQTVHDIRTPVTLIMTPLEDLSRETGLSRDGQTFLNMARNNARKLNELVTQLLDFERIDSGSTVTPVPVDLGELLSAEMARFTPVCEKKHLATAVSLPAGGIALLTDRKIVEAILDNLISNACKYTLEGGEVRVGAAVSGRHVVITVADTGIGIPAEAHRHLFTDIYRADNAKQLKEVGTGFGLLQVQRLVGLLRGRICYKSVVGKGSVFTVTLPYTPAVVTSPATADSDLPQVTVSDTVTELTAGDITPPADENADSLLVVEDNDELRYYLNKTLSHDYRVTAVASGEEALEHLAGNYPDLILSDVMMPGIQGDELCRRVKDNPATAGIPVILLTAKVNHDAVMEGIRKGADDYIPKPFSTDLLKARIHGMIENRRRLREVFMREVLQHVAVTEEGAAVPATVPPVVSAPARSADTVAAPAPADNPADREFVDKATSTVVQHLSDADFSINDLCREMAMSRTLFYSRLKSLTGKAPQEFIRLIRLERAAALLRRGGKVGEVALKTGFANTKYFSVLFKKAYGIEPSKYGAGRG